MDLKFKSHCAAPPLYKSCSSTQYQVPTWVFSRWGNRDLAKSGDLLSKARCHDDTEAIMAAGGTFHPCFCQATIIIIPFAVLWLGLWAQCRHMCRLYIITHPWWVEWDSTTHCYQMPQNYQMSQNCMQFCKHEMQLGVIHPQTATSGASENITKEKCGWSTVYEVLTNHWCIKKPTRLGM
jgi:hypothetical protein